MIEKMVNTMARRAMLDNIDALDIDTLRKQLRQHLEEEFKLVDILDEFEEYLETRIVCGPESESYKNVFIEVWDKLRQIKENK